MEIEDYVHGLPKVELHVHIEGTLSPELRWECCQRNGVQLPHDTFEAFKSEFRPWEDEATEAKLGANGLAVFLAQYYGGIESLKTSNDYYELASNYFDRANAMNVRHAEVFFDPQAHTRRGVAVDVLMSGLLKAKQEAEAKYPLTVSYIMCLLRDESVESARDIYEACRPFQHSVFVGLGLDSNEHDRPPLLFDDLFALARRDGLRVTSHCDVGQKNTLEHIRQVAKTLCGGRGLDRIDHGLSAADDPELVKLIVQQGLGMTLVPHAYRRRWPEEWVFPAIRTLHDAGIPITISSDDPTYMQDFWIDDNYQLVREKCGFDNAQLSQLSRNAIDICWATAERKQALYQELDAYGH